MQLSHTSGDIFEEFTDLCVYYEAQAIKQEKAQSLERQERVRRQVKALESDWNSMGLRNMVSGEAGIEPAQAPRGEARGLEVMWLQIERGPEHGIFVRKKGYEKCERLHEQEGFFLMAGFEVLKAELMPAIRECIQNYMLFWVGVAFPIALISWYLFSGYTCHLIC